MSKNISQIVKKLGDDKDYIRFQKQEEFIEQKKKQSMNINKFSFAMQQCVSQNVTFSQNEIKFIFHYIDCEEYNNLEKPKIENPNLEISLQQIHQKNRQINDENINDQIYFKKVIQLNETDLRFNLKLDLINNKIVEQFFVLQAYDEQDTIKFTLKGQNIEIFNQYPLYLFLDKFKVGQKFQIYIQDGLYLSFETLYCPNDFPNIDKLNKSKIQKNEQLIEPIYCEQFIKLPQDYTQFLQEYYLSLQQVQDQLDKTQSIMLDSSRVYNSSQLKDFKYKNEYDQTTLNIYNYQLKQISREWIIKQELVQKIQNFIQQLQANKNDTKIIKFTNFYQEINAYFEIMQDQSLYDKNILFQANQMLLSGLTMNLRLEFYRQYGQVESLQKSFIQQIKLKYEKDIKVDGLYEFIKGKINFNCQIQQNLRDDIAKFESNIANSYKIWAYQALQSWVSVIQQFIFNNVKIYSGKYIIQYAFKLLQIIINHDYYKQNPQISEELIFWLILTQSIFFNYDFQEEIGQQDQDANFSSENAQNTIVMKDIQIIMAGSQIQQRLKLNQKIINGLIFLRFCISNYYPKIYSLVEKYKINIELMFCESLQQLCFDLLNSNIYYRLLDIAYGLIQEGLGYFHFAIVLAIMYFFDENAQYVTSYKSFIDIFKFSAQNIYRESQFINLVLHFRIDLDKEYRDFSQLIKQKNAFYKNFDYKQEAMEYLLQNQNTFDLNDITQIIGNSDQNKTQLVPHEQFKQNPEFIHIFVKNPTHLEVQVQVQEILKNFNKGYIKLKYEQELKFVANDKVIFQINCDALPLNVLIQQTTITNIQFNVIIEYSRTIVSSIQEIVSQIPKEYYNVFLHNHQNFTFNNGQLFDKIQSDQQCNVQSIFVSDQQWKQDSILKQNQLIKILQQNDIFKQNKDLGNFCSKFDNQIFYFKEFLIDLILNSSGRLKQKMQVFYDSFKLLNNNIFHMKLMLEILTEIFHFCKIPILRQELLNAISFIQYKDVNKIQNAIIERGDKNIDVTDILQNYLDLNFQKYGAQSIFLDDLQTIIQDYKEDIEGSFVSINQEKQNKDSLVDFLKSSIQNGEKNDQNLNNDNKDAFIPNINNDIFMEPSQITLLQKIDDLKNPEQSLQLIINYKQNFQTRSVKYILSDDLKIVMDSQGDKNIQNLNILNMNFDYQDLEFWEFWKVCSKLNILTNSIIQDQSLNQHQQKATIECKFLIFVGDQELKQIKFKQEFQNKLMMLNLSNYEQNLGLLMSDQNQSKVSQQQFILTDQLDILLPFKHLYKQLSNILIINHIEKPILNFKNVNLTKQPKVSLINDITPSGIMELSLLDIQQITQKGFKDFEIKIQYEPLNGSVIDITVVNTKDKFQF